MDKAKANKLREGSHLYCYDWEEPGFDIYGLSERSDDYQVLEFGLYPCASRYTAMDGTVHGGGDDCVWDFEEYQEYMGSAINLIEMHNRGTFKEDEYG